MSDALTEYADNRDRWHYAVNLGFDDEYVDQCFTHMQATEARVRAVIDAARAVASLVKLFNNEQFPALHKLSDALDAFDGTEDA